MIKSTKPPSNTNFLNWLMLFGLIAFFIYVLFDLGILAFIAATDSTYVSQLIFLLFVMCSAFIGQRNWVVDREIQMSHLIYDAYQQGQYKDDLYKLHKMPHEQGSYTSNYMKQALQNKTDKDISQLSEIYAQALAGPHKIGWFVSGTLIKLGLLGTVIGFVIMLSTISDLEQLDISGVKQLMQQMTQGMGVAMFTTMSGLVGSMLLSLQCLMLERGTDRLISQSVGFAQAFSAEMSDSLTNSEEVLSGPV